MHEQIKRKHEYFVGRLCLRGSVYRRMVCTRPPDTRTTYVYYFMNELTDTTAEYWMCTANYDETTELAASREPTLCNRIVSNKANAFDVPLVLWTLGSEN